MVNMEEKRVLFRPRLDTKKICLWLLRILLSLALVCLVVYAVQRYILGCFLLLDWLLWSLLISSIIWAAIIIRNIKAFSIFLILVYQRFAPSKVRLRCVYTPSCSEYMKLAIEKYGFIEGVKRGWDRLDRCHYPHSGEDWP